jgi:hypothetical protein
MKQVGAGFEVGFNFGKTSIFVGNFIHTKEATKWWGVMNKEMKSFTKRYRVGQEASVTWYTKFFANYLYNSYYTFLDQQFNKYQKTFAKAVKHDAKKYVHLKKNWNKHDEVFHFVKTA